MWSGLYNDIGGADHSLLVDEAPLNKKIGRSIKKLPVLKELMVTLNGVAVGGTPAALKVTERITGQGVVVNQSTGEMTTKPSDIARGGAVLVASEDNINRATATSDQTAINNIINQLHRPATYVADLSGNGGAAYAP